MFAVKDWLQRLGVLEPDRFPNVLDDLGHAEGDDDTAAHIVRVEQDRGDDDPIRLEHLIHQSE